MKELTFDSIEIFARRNVFVFFECIEESGSRSKPRCFANGLCGVLSVGWELHDFFGMLNAVFIAKIYKADL
jgi:hypothetical protein